MSCGWLIDIGCTEDKLLNLFLFPEHSRDRITYYHGPERARLFAVNPFILWCVRCDNLPRRRKERERERERESEERTRKVFFADAELLISHAFSDGIGIENGLDRASSSQYHVKSTRFPREWRGIRTVSDGDNVEQPELR